MEPEQCVEIINSLRDTLTQISQTKSIPKEKIFELKHVVMEIEMSVISMKKSIEKLLHCIENEKWLF